MENDASATLVLAAPARTSKWVIWAQWSAATFAGFLLAMGFACLPGMSEETGLAGPQFSVDALFLPVIFGVMAFLSAALQGWVLGKHLGLKNFSDYLGWPAATMAGAALGGAFLIGSELGTPWLFYPILGAIPGAIGQAIYGGLFLFKSKRIILAWVAIRIAVLLLAGQVVAPPLLGLLTTMPEISEAFNGNLGFGLFIAVALGIPMGMLGGWFIAGRVQAQTARSESLPPSEG